MNVPDWIAVSSVAIVAIGWFANGFLNRRHEIAKERMKYRLEALHSFLPAFFAITKENHMSTAELEKELGAARTKFQLYCHKNEIDAFERLVTAIEEGDNKAYTDAVRDLICLVRKGIRNELGLGKYEYLERHP